MSQIHPLLLQLSTTNLLEFLQQNSPKMDQALAISSPESVKSSPTSISPGSEKSVKIAKGSSGPRVKRPMNAFMVWSQIRRQEISANGGKYHNSDISKMLGAEWRLMKEEEKTPFVQKARDLREQHFIEHPDYVYRPRRKKRAVKSAASTAPTTSIPAVPQMETPARFTANFDSKVEVTPLISPQMLNHLLYTHFLNQLVQQNPIQTFGQPQSSLNLPTSPTTPQSFP